MIDRLVSRALRLLPPEAAHDAAIALLRQHGLRLFRPRDPDPILRSVVLGLDLPSPLGLAAGFDKNAEAIDGAFGMGFGFVEIGSVTPRPQPGNPKPRVFRLNADHAVINRMGFNNDGIAAVAARVEGWRVSASARRGILGVNLGKNKDSEDAAADYAIGAARFAKIADYLVVNVSSPNTPGLRALQSKESLLAILRRTRAARDGATSGGKSLDQPRAWSVPLLVKVAPDLAEQDLLDIAELAMQGEMDGLIVSNTTVARPAELQSPHRNEMGGLSGAPLKPMALEMLRRLRMLTHGEVVLIGVGGISNADDAYARIRAGAHLVQLYTGLIYGGIGLPAEILRGLAARLRADGFRSVSEAVGIDAR